MLDLSYSLVIEATEEPDFFGFYSPELEGFTGVGHSIEDCVFKARWGMKEHVELLKKHALPVPNKNPNPKSYSKYRDSMCVPNPPLTPPCACPTHHRTAACVPVPSPHRRVR